MNASSQLPERLLRLLRCPRCRGTLTASSSQLTCAACGHTVPVRDGIPRFVTTPEDPLARQTQASFGYEWTEFNNPQPSGEENFLDYFEGAPLDSLGGSSVLDAGCGMGRHATQMAAYAAHVVAVDFSAAIEQAKRNTASRGNVDCVQGDLTNLPFADESFDYVYSIGVLHHLADTPGAIRKVVEKAKIGGRVRIYLYWKRTGVSGVLLTGVSAVRRVTTKMPFPMLKAASWLLSVGLMGGVVLPYRALSKAGVRAHADWPLFVYAKYPFNVLYNDQFDRFSAPIEQRFTADEVRQMLNSAGVGDVNVYPRFGWVAEGVRNR